MLENEQHNCLSQLLFGLGIVLNQQCLEFDVLKLCLWPSALLVSHAILYKLFSMEYVPHMLQQAIDVIEQQF